MVAFRAMDEKKPARRRAGLLLFKVLLYVARQRRLERLTVDHRLLLLVAGIAITIYGANLLVGVMPSPMKAKAISFCPGYNGEPPLFDEPR